MNTSIRILLLLIVGLNTFDARGSETNSTITQFTIETNQNDLIRSFAWGDPKDNVSAGVKTLNRSDRESMHADVLVCLLNIGKIDASQYAWIAPPDFQRVEWFMYDLSGKPIPYSPKYHPVDKKYQFISEVPRDAHHVHMGLLLLRNDFPRLYEQAMLTNVFQIENDGDYKLVVKARLMEIHDDLPLSTVILPPVSLTVHFQNGEIANKTN